MLTIGSRGSKLALWQARYIQSRLEGSRIEVIHTTGDKIQDVALSKVGSKGLFTKEIEEALLNGSIDLAVHSLKDLPTELPAGLIIAAVPEREDPRDALVGSKLADLPRGARVGTSSLRRSAQLRALRADLRLDDIRGNVDTRLRKLDEGQFDAIVLASAGLVRLGLRHRITEFLEPDVMCPAVGQGALAIETREGDQTCNHLDHPATRIAVTAERALLRALGGGCQVPIGALAVPEAAGPHGSVPHGSSLVLLRAVIAHPLTGQLIRGSIEFQPAQAESAGAALANQLLEKGGQEILQSVYSQA